MENPARPAPLGHPLTPLQQGMLFHQLTSSSTGSSSDPSSGVDVEQIVCRLEHALDVEDFKRAWGQVLARHDSLRSAFQWEGLEEPLQTPAERLELDLTELDVRGADAEAELRKLLAAERARRFDLSRAPLMRWRILRTTDSACIVVWTFPHLVLDGRSFPQVLSEVFASYDALREGRTANFPPARQFREHVAALSKRERLSEEPFWRTYLEGFSGPVSLPLAKPSRAALEGQPTRGEKRGRLSKAATDALRKLADEQKVSLNTLVQGAWSLLLARYTQEHDLVFGCVRACRRSTVEGADEIVGTFINTLPFRAKVDEELALVDWLAQLRASQRAIGPNEHAALADIQRWSRVAVGAQMFDSILVFDNALLDTHVKSLPGNWAARSFELHEQTIYPLTLYVYAEPELDLKLAYDRSTISDTSAARIVACLSTLLEEFGANPARKLSAIPMLPAVEARDALEGWKRARTPYAKDAVIADLFVAQVERTPDAVALCFEHREMTYRELDARANQLAHRLRKLGVGRDVLVGIYTKRSLEMVVAVLGVLKAGGAYVPLDPTYPADRVSYQIADSKLGVLVTQPGLSDALETDGVKKVELDEQWQALQGEPAHEPERENGAADLAYVIYTSGSTGRPKGVMLEQRNVLNFFAGMDARVGGEGGGVWLAVTSLSFDISVLELLWTLTRGYKVVVQPTPRAVGSAATVSSTAPRKTDVSFSLFYFPAEDGGERSAKYELLFDGARFADRNGFEAVWTPERHFHAFGGMYPNPSVTSAALSSITEHVALRAGSIVLPLHDPIRVAEEWSLVDNLSKGRVGIAIASGWQPNDFVLAPHNHAQRKEVMFKNIETVRALWRGEPIEVPGPDGAPVEVRTMPRPIQKELPVWVTTAGNVDTFKGAAQGGFNVLTHLLGQSLADVKAKVAAYRETWREKGHAGRGRVTLMLHTFVGRSDREVYDAVRGPMIEYLRSSAGLARNFIASFPTFKTQGAGEAEQMSSDFKQLSDADMDAILSHSFERYFAQSGLFGTVETCEALVEKLREIGVDEIACLVDFGVPAQVVREHFPLLAELKRRVVAREQEEREARVPTAIERHAVTHMQCTPSMASMLLAEDGGPEALRRLRKLLIGGEAFPPALARELKSLVPAVINMYGPTETTVWSSTYALEGGEEQIPIGRAIANTELLVLDARNRPMPREAPGELYIGGDGVARGYLGRPELTAERFVAHPLRGDAGGRVYRTGDLARIRDDGQVEFLGRNDGQVKLRGYRIELGEIEARLGEHEDVRECAVVVRTDNGAEPRLVAYFAPREGRKLERAQLRAFLSERLPEFMLPTAWVELAVLPKTPNAKIDRKALPAPEDVAVAPRRAAQPPENELERQIAAIWRDVLAAPEIGRDENFFDLGGHSLLTVQVQGRLRRQLNRTVALTDLFRFPTVRTLAQFLSIDVGEQQKAENQALDEQADARAKARQEGADRRALLLNRRRPQS
jgi:natural product biosynthesis luciferase-like monooxygenase protein